jgi:Flp pilus assembly protein TadD
MKFAVCAAAAVIAAHVGLAQQSNLDPTTRHYVIAEAKTISVQELEQRHESKARGVFADAKAAAHRGDHKGAIKLFEKAIKIDPAFLDARNDLAVELIVSGQPDRAIEELQQLVQLDPHFTMGYTNLGVILCTEKKFSDAEAVLRRALSLEPTLPKANLLLAIALYGQGKRGTETQNALQTAAKSSPVATKLLHDWFGVSDITEANAAN